MILLIILVTGLIRRIIALETRRPDDHERHQLGPEVGVPAPIVHGHERLSEIDGDFGAESFSS
ncbi:MAG: hypothetical protein ACP5H2_06215 [Solirubrobacteraceae bacterium]